jgi:hypothetical protein
MFSFHTQRSRTAALMALAISTSTAIPFLTTSVVQAQRLPDPPTFPWLDAKAPSPSPSPVPKDNQAQVPRPNNNSNNYAVAIAAGTSISVQYNEAEKIIVMPDETKDLTLTVAKNITSRQGTILIPAGSKIVGRLQPARNGSQFVARELVVNQGRSRQEQRYDIVANSRVVTRTERVRRGSNTTAIARNAAIGAAAAATLAAISGDKVIATEEILGGAGLGALSGLLLNRQRSVDVVVIYPNRDLTVRLESELALR